MENLGDGVRGGPRVGETEVGGLDELSGESGGGEVAELCIEWSEVGEVR